MASLHGAISKSRSELEKQSIDTANTKDAVTFITYVQSLKSKFLERQRFHFPNNWLHVDNIEGEWSAFSEIMKRKNASIQQQVTSLQVKIVAEDKSVEARTVEFLSELERGKPVAGFTNPKEAISRLSIFESKFNHLCDDRDNIMRAREALELLDPGSVASSPNDEKLAVSLEELQDLKAVWTELAFVWEQIEALKELPWLSVQPRKLCQQLDGLLTQLKEMPAKMRQYASYDYVKRVLQSYTKSNVFIVELKSDALKERHWRALTKQLKVSWVLSELTLGQVWDLDLQRNELIIKDIIQVPQGEMALEEFLKQVREFWQTYELDLVNYQSKCRIIRGWDDLFTKVKEHINSITAMKLSPYYREFEEDALSWEEKLNRINAIFDVWIDVQPRWVYLEGIFSGSSDIQALLPVETSRFQSISSEFLQLMKKVSKNPMIMDVMNIPGVQRSLERLSDLLGKVQKALGEYLERKRSSFPRFYFVGDEDLLEIIGNSKNIPRLQKHFKKMFAGVASIILSEPENGGSGGAGAAGAGATTTAAQSGAPPNVLGLCSKEGEEVRSANPISIAENSKINKWLSLFTRRLIKSGVSSPKCFEWLAQMRFYFDPKQTDVLQQLTIHMANAKFFYGFEYLGVQEKLVQTPLTDRCYLTMTQALEGRLGGSPFAPAGTGKTESVKALVNQLGRFVLVFNCDETFDFQAMGRIFVGLCQVGVWGCFIEKVNRLEGFVKVAKGATSQCVKSYECPMYTKQATLPYPVLRKLAAAASVPANQASLLGSLNPTTLFNEKGTALGLAILKVVNSSNLVVEDLVNQGEEIMKRAFKENKMEDEMKEVVEIIQLVV
ncbi:Cytoplasmic dynein 1 heavy chain 1 [Tyrophagus putrescentiae]|nr:Cytoplasmic dynein 1 heavy chain 1 [Tyrophagus putrescentiae]